MIIEALLSILLSILLMFNPILLDNNIDIVNDYVIELEYEIKEDDLKIYFDYLNDTINRSERIGYWTCYDYSVDFAKNNHGWGIVTTSYFEDFENPDFYGVDSHMINYYLYDNETMIVYDSFQDNMYISHGWKYDCRNYYHFWLDNSIPVRRYYEMSDNRDVVM